MQHQSDLEKGAGSPPPTTINNDINQGWTPPTYEQHVNANMRDFSSSEPHKTRLQPFDSIQEPKRRKRDCLTRRQWALLALLLCFMLGAMGGILIWAVMNASKGGDRVSATQTVFRTVADASQLSTSSPQSEVTTVVLQPDVETVFVTTTPTQTVLRTPLVTTYTVTPSASATVVSEMVIFTVMPSASSISASSNSSSSISTTSSTTSSITSSPTSSSTSLSSPAPTTIMKDTTDTATTTITPIPSTTLMGGPVGMCGVLGESC